MSARSLERQFVDFKTVKAAVSMEQVLQRYNLLADLRRSGDRLSGYCPIHKGTNAQQFRVSLTKNVWHCFGNCGGGGNVLDFVSAMENVPVKEAALLLTQWFGLLPPPPRPPKPPKPEREAGPAAQEVDTESALAPPNPALDFELQNLDPEHTYLAERGLTPEIIAQFGLGYCGKGLMRGRIAIPIHNFAGELVAYCGRWPGKPPEDKPKYSLPKDFRKSLELFNAHSVWESMEPGDHSSGPLFIVEGYFDCMKLVQAGFPNTVALMGSSLSPQQELIIGELLNESAAIVLLLDEDEAGRRARTEIGARLSLRYFVRAIPLPEEGMQPDVLSGEQLASLIGPALADTPLCLNR
jgi:DNA primase